MISNLNPQDEKYLDSASPIGIQKSGLNLLDYFINNCWLDTGNTYRYNPIEAIKKNIKTTGIKSQDMREYIAVSIFLHLFDGWDYIGRALYAQISGAPIAIHLGYYAEMRATMSLLATQGIGIFNRQHFVVDKGGFVHPISDKKVLQHPTHKAVWLYLEHWLRSRDAGKQLSRIIRPRSIPLIDWINEMPCTAEEGWTLVASDMLRNFGVDLKRMTNDQAMRNEASYRPFELSSYRNPAFREVVKFVYDTVCILEPSTARGSFDNLDRYLLCQTVEKVFHSIKSAPRNEPKEYEQEVTAMLDTVLGEDSVYKETIQRFILKHALRQHIPNLIDLASDRCNISDPRPLLSRAVLLLRIASGIASEFMKETDINFELLKFFWSRRGWELGLWEDINDPLSIADLWGDMAYALEEIEEWLYSDNVSVRSLLSNCARSLHTATNLGRFAIIGLAS